MVYLINDVLYSIFEELRNDKKSLYSCLLVDRTWCVVAVPILWKNPIRTDNPNYYLSEKVVCALFNVICSHLSVESREDLKRLKSDTETYQHPSFNYINFWRHLNFDHLNYIIEQKLIGTSNDFNVSTIRNEILKLFINRDTKFTHLSIYINYPLHQISGTEHCFSELESFCYTVNSEVNSGQSILEGLARICKSIKKLVFEIIRCPTDNSGFIKLIEVQKNLNDVCIFHIYDGDDPNNSFYKTLEEILIKHANTLKYLRIDWKPITRFLSYLVNLLSLEIRIPHLVYYNEPDNLKNSSFPILRILKVRQIPSKIITNLIESTKGNLVKIKIKYCDSVNIKRLIQAIYQNCPNLEYLKLSLLSDADLIFPEFENLLIKCKFLNGLVFNTYDDKFDWVNLFSILTKSSPISLINFKFFSIKVQYIKDVTLFLDNWKDRYPISLILNNRNLNYTGVKQQLQDYKTKGIIKKCYFNGREI